MKKLSLTVVTICCLFFIIFIVAGCAKKVPMAPEEVKSEEVPAPRTYEEETIYPRSEEPSKVKRVPREEFKERTVSSGPKRFKSSVNLATVHFDFDKYSIRHEDREILNRNARWLRNNPKVVVKIEGHCDERGTSDYNLALGDKRATATKNYLVSLGISSSKISIISYGEERLLCSETSKACWSKNRRAEFLMAK